MIVLDPARLRQVRQRPDDQYAYLFGVGGCPQPGRLTALYREFVTHDEEGVETERRRERVVDVLDGERVPVACTVVGRAELVWLDDLTLEMARAAGHRTTDALRGAWRESHPRTDRVDVAWWILGDRRDQPLFLQWTGRGADYTHNRARAADDAEALTPEQLLELAQGARQRDQARRAASSRTEETLAQRVARLEATFEVAKRAGDTDTWKAIRQELRIIQERAERASAKLQRGLG